MFCHSNVKQPISSRHFTATPLLQCRSGVRSLDFPSHVLVFSCFFPEHFDPRPLEIFKVRYTSASARPAKTQNSSWVIAAGDGQEDFHWGPMGFIQMNVHIYRWWIGDEWGNHGQPIGDGFGGYMYWEANMKHDMTHKQLVPTELVATCIIQHFILICCILQRVF